MGRAQLLIALLTIFVGILVAWFVRRGYWRQSRLLPITIALGVAFAVLSRRVGWGELLVVASVILVPMLLMPVQPRR